MHVAQLTHITAVKGTKAQKKKFKPPKLSWPSTALDGLKARARARQSEATKRFTSMFEFVPQQQFEAELAEHQAALAADPNGPSPVQQRALAEARARNRTTRSVLRRPRRPTAGSRTTT